MPRAGLTPEVVVAGAADLVDDVGLEHLTLAAIAERFGVAVPSLYKHVAGVDDLRRRLATRAVHELGDALSVAAGGRDPADALRAVADAYRAYALAHPGRYAATQRAPEPDDVEHTAASQQVLGTMLAMLAGYGITGDDAIDATRTVRSALHGFIALETNGGFGLPHDVDRSFRRLTDALDDALEHWS